MENIYCRFCAEPKSTEKVLNLEEDNEKLNEILIKLFFLNAVYVDMSNIKSALPKTVCFACYNSLNSAYEFLYKVKNAQYFLADLISINNEEKKPFDDEQSTALNDIEAENVVETLEDVENDKCNLRAMNNSTVLTVKEELTDLDVVTLFQGTLKDSHSSNKYDLNLCEQDNLDAVTICKKDKKSSKSWNEYPWICTYCSIELKDLETLRSHSKVVHNKCAAFSCVDCNKFNGSFLDSNNEDFNVFINHVKKHRRELRNLCHYCDMLINKPENLNGHVKSHFRKSEVSCCHCGEILKNKEALQKHLSEYKYVKPQPRTHRKPGQLITKDEVTCKHCHKEYSTPWKLREHIKLHMKDRKRDYACDRCGKTFFDKHTLTGHIKSHDKVRPYLCKICNRTFLYVNRLQSHLLTHTNIKKFSCEQCGRCFRQQYQLNSHKIIHTDAMPHVCQYCNKAFRFKQILKNHERQHTGSKPYSCQLCTLEFTNWPNYNKHMKRRHNTDTSKKKITPNGVFPVNPETGQIMQVEDPVGTEEWKSKIMSLGKRRRKNISKIKT